MNNEEILLYATRLLDETREEVRMADAKAATLLAASGIAVTLLLGLDASRGSSLRTLPNWSAALLLLACTATVVGIGLLGLAVLPRSTTSTKDRVPPYFFGEVARYGMDEGRLMKDLAQAPQQITERTVSQLLVVSRIVVRKYRYVRYGLLCFSFAALLATVATYPIWRLR